MPKMINKHNMILPASLMIILLCFFTTGVTSKELIVGGEEGWAVPKSKDEQQRLFFFNDWASSNRFQLNDTLRFKYQKDSVMVVAEEEEYNKCRSSHPVVYFNDGDTSFALDRPGLFYFISGVTGHCERGLKMTVKVLDVDNYAGDGDAPSGQPDDGREEKSSAGASSAEYSAASIAAAALLALSLLF